jgi:hypothetical protein
MIQYYRHVILFFILGFSLTTLNAQEQVFPYGTKIALISDLNGWLSLCENCQDLNNPSVKFTVTADSPLKGRPDENSIWTVEHQDGKYRFKSFKNTYMSICQGCRKNNPNGALVVANATLNRQGKVPKEALFDIISVPNSSHYQIVSYQGNYITRNYAPSKTKKGSQILMASYGFPCRSSSKFKIIELARQSHQVIMEHTELSGIGWISALTGEGFNQYLAKDISSERLFVPKAQNLYRKSSNIGFRLFENAYYIGYASNGKKTDSYLNLNETDASLKLGPLTGRKQQNWNLIRLGTTKNRLGQKKILFYIKSLLNEQYIKTVGQQLLAGTVDDASIFMFEKNAMGLEGRRSDLRVNYEILKVPGTNITVLNPNSLPKTSFYWTQKIYLDKKFSYKGATWRLATLPEIKKIFKILVDKRCYLDVNGQYYYIKESGQGYGYIHPHYMGLVKSEKVVFASYEDKNTRRKVLLIKE